MKLVGILLVVLGIVALAVGGFGYTDREKVIDLGPIQATKVEHKTVPIPPLAGGAAVIAGIALVIVGSRRRA
jgi:hypothetical protein